MNVLHKMNFHIALALVLGAFHSLASGEEPSTPKPLQMNVAGVYDFFVSLSELRERNQIKRFNKAELEVIAGALGAAKFLKKMEHEDVAQTPYISRYEFTHGFLGGTPRTGETEFGMLTMDCRRFYWDDLIFEIDPANAEKLKKLFPEPRNPLTKSELPAIRPEEKAAEQDGRGQPTTRPESK